MIVLYRISDGGTLKNKLPFANKMHCLDNFCSVFKDETIIIFADNCKQETLDKLKTFSGKIIETSLGNSGSWRYCVDYAIKNFDDEEIIYLMEDDYLHFSNSPRLIKEGLDIAEYVTLYDHPDKYINKTEGGNPLVKGGGEPTRVLLSKSSHWKITNSTTMTFAARVKTLKADRNIWQLATSRKIPKDYLAFKFLGGHGSLLFKLFGKKRRLISPIPAYSTHIETAALAPLRDWNIFDTQKNKVNV